MEPTKSQTAGSKRFLEDTTKKKKTMPTGKEDDKAGALSTTPTLRMEAKTMAGAQMTAVTTEAGTQKATTTVKQKNRTNVERNAERVLEQPEVTLTVPRTKIHPLPEPTANRDHTTPPNMLLYVQVRIPTTLVLTSTADTQR